MLKIGLTGGIGSGKSTVCNLFEELGVPIIDADVIAHQIVAPGQPALKQLQETFGQQIIDTNGALDRAALRERVFNDSTQKKRLENILHPLVYARIASEVQQLTNPYCILCIPLLLETGKTQIVDRVLVIDCPLQTQIERVKRRDGLSTELINRIIVNQASREERLACADDIIDNANNSEQLAEQVKKLHNLYLKLSS